MNIYTDVEGVVYCEDCGKRIQEEQNIKLDFTENYNNHEADFVQHCGEHFNCINAIEVNGIKYGCWLENRLTDYGVELLWSDIINGKADILSLWKEWYAEQLADYRMSIQMFSEYLQNVNQHLQIVAIVGEQKFTIHLAGYDDNKKRFLLLNFWNDPSDVDFPPLYMQSLLQDISALNSTEVENHPMIGIFNVLSKDQEEHRLLLVEVFDDRVELIFDEEEP